MMLAQKRKLQEILGMLGLSVHSCMLATSPHSFPDADSISETCVSKVDESIYSLDSPTQPGNQNATPEFTLSIIEKAQTASTEFELALMQSLRSAASNHVNQVEAIRSALSLTQAMGDVLENAKGITRLAKRDEDVEEIVRQAKSSCTVSTRVRQVATPATNCI